MKYTVSVAMSPLDDLLEIAKAAEEFGFDNIALPDSIFYMEKQSTDYPYTPDGSRMWDQDTPWVDPLILAGAMGAVTSKIRFYTNVMKLGSRNPLLLARQVGSVANLTKNRFGFGVGIGWAPEEFEWCGVPYAKRGKRIDEMIEVIKLVLAGGMVEFHGEFYDFDKLQMSPAPSEPVPFYVGGHTEVALKRAARVSDGWTSAMMTCDELAETITNPVSSGWSTSTGAETGDLCAWTFGATATSPGSCNGTSAACAQHNILLGGVPLLIQQIVRQSPPALASTARPVPGACSMCASKTCPRPR